MKKAISILLAVMMVVSMVAINGLVSASAENNLTAKSNYVLIDPGKEKSAGDIYQCTTGTTAALSVEQIGSDKIPSSGYTGTATSAYVCDTVAKTNKAGFVYSFDAIDASHMYANYSKYTLDLWIYSSSSLTNTFVIRILCRETTASNSNIEYHLFQMGTLVSSSLKNLSPGWNHVQVPLLKGGQKSPTTIQAIAFEQHDANTPAYTLAVAEAKIIGPELAIDITGAKTSFNVGEEFTSDGIAATFDGASVDASSLTIDSSKFTSLVSGTCPIYVSYKGAVASYDVTVEGDTQGLIIDTKNVKKTFLQFGQFDYSGLITYYNGQVVTPDSVTAPNMATIGEKTITVSYGSDSVTYSVNVIKAGTAVFASSDEAVSKTSGANWNSDNYILGNSTLELTVAEGGGAQVGFISFEEPLDFSGVDYIESWVYMPQETLDAAAAAANGNNVALYFEFSSGGGYASHCARYLFNGATNLTNSLSKTFTAGWNKIKFPTSFTVNSGTNYCYKDNMWCGFGSGQTDYTVDFSAINYIRVIFQGTNAVGQSVGVNGFGYGFDTMIGTDYAGNSLETAVAGAPAGKTVKLNNDFTVDEAINVTKTITVDLNGHDITSNADYAFSVSNKAVLALGDSHALRQNLPDYGTITAKVAPYTVAEGSYVNCSHRYTYTVTTPNTCTTDGLKHGVCSICGDDTDEVIPASHVLAHFEAVHSTCVTEGNIEYWQCTVCKKVYTDENAQNQIFASQTVIPTLTANVTEETDSAIVYDGDWTAINNLKNAGGNSVIRGSKSGSSIRFSFNGSALAIVGYTSPTYGKISITVDELDEEIIDLYSASQDWQKVIYDRYLSDGLHTVTVKILAEKNDAASRKGLYYAALDSIITDGALVSAEKVIDDMNISINDTVTEITIPYPVTSEGETALEASAENGTAEVTGSDKITYTASAFCSKDTITYTVNGFTGKINVNYNGVVNEFENNPTPKGWGATNSWYFSGHSALFADVAGREYTMTVTAGAMELVGYKSARYGEFEVYVDGEKAEVYDEYVSSGYHYKESLGVLNLGTYGEHTVTIKAVGRTLLDSYTLHRLVNFNAVEASLTERGEQLYESTYASMTNRIDEYGYAITSVTGAYEGMFVRDSSIQIMSHIANGDPELAKALLNYTLSYHIQNGRQYTLHIMNPLNTSTTYSYTNPASAVNRVQEATTSGLYRIDMSDYMAAQCYTSTGETVTEVDMCLSTVSTSGYYVLGITTGLTETPIATARVDITSETSSKNWVKFVFDSPVDLSVDTDYFITIAAYDTNGKSVAYGITSGGTYTSYAYDVASFGGWKDRPYTLAYKIITKEDASGGDTTIKSVETLESDSSANISFGTSNGYVVAVTPTLSYTGSAEGTVYFDLYKGTTLLKTIEMPTGKLSSDAQEIRLSFGLPLVKIPTGGTWNMTIRTQDIGSGKVEIYGSEAYGKAYTAECSSITPYSKMIQVDGNYMFVDAYSMFALDYFNEYRDFVEDTFDTVMGFASYFMNNSSYFISDLNILRDPNYEHGREGRYWNSYCLMTNVYASQGCHELALVAKKLGRTADAETLQGYADTIAQGIHDNLTCTVNGKKIYTEIIDLDNNNAVTKGFSFVSLAPVAANWYAVDDQIMQNTFDEYTKAGTVQFGGKDILSSYVDLNADDSKKYAAAYCTGKGLSWELIYNWKMGNTERVNDILAMIDEFSSNAYNEGYYCNGDVRDEANQEHANWIFYEVARVTGRYNH